MSFEDLKTFFDSRQFSADAKFEYDICIIGAGPAGISIAREFGSSEARVVLLESGGREYEDDIETLNTLTVKGREYREQGTRLRAFGGTSYLWGGHCAPMTPGNFKKRDWIPYSGWPLDIEELHPYYARAHEILEIGPYDYRPESAAERLGLNLLPFDPKIVKTQLSRYHRQNFGLRYAKELDAADNVTVFLYATVTSINLDEHKRFVSDVTVKTLEGNSFGVRAKVFVLATGGIENARILLLNNRDMAKGLGNQHDIVGRFFMEHMYYQSGFILPVEQNREKAQLYGTENYFEDDYDVRTHLVLPEAWLRKLRIPMYRAELDILRSRQYPPSVRPSHKLKHVLKSVGIDSVTLRDIAAIVKDLGLPLKNLLDDSDGPLIYGFANNVEQCPNPESRVRLAEKRDVLGQKMAELNWRLSDLDYAGVRRAQHLIAREVGRLGIGRMHVSIPASEREISPFVRGCNHHMGTTRMHADPKQGVVDADCRIHGIENIFVAGSSVFPTGGYPNPTLTITALAIRLADHLKTELARL